MKKSKEGEVDYDAPQDEGGIVKPDEDPRRRNMSGRFPGEANEEKLEDSEDKRKEGLGDGGKPAPPKPSTDT